LLPISRWYPSFLDENTQIWMNKCTFIHNLDVSSTHMDEGGSYTVIKIASALILIIEKKITGPECTRWLSTTHHPGFLASMLWVVSSLMPVCTNTE
jgi:hypothetical protein